MKITKVVVDNFQSYGHLEFDYSDLGLCLVSGETGAGKSTLMDVASWVLFGITSKEGKADDVRSWNSDETTQGTITVQFPTGELVVTRKRGSVNDLFLVESGNVVRGKDLTDTQKIIEERLGVTSELFLVGSYMTQFSKADDFFIAKAKDRREVLEAIADQEFAVVLGVKASEARKHAKKQKEELDLELSGVSGKIEVLTESVEQLADDTARWQQELKEAVSSLTKKYNTFDHTKDHTISTLRNKKLEWETEKNAKLAALKAKIKAVPSTRDDSHFFTTLATIDRDILNLRPVSCPECGVASADSVKAVLMEQSRDISEARNINSLRVRKRAEFTREYKTLEALVNPHSAAIDQAQAQQNPYGAQLEYKTLEVNPYAKKMSLALSQLSVQESARQDVLKRLSSVNSEVSLLSWIYDASFELRSIMMRNAVSNIQSSTNSYLERFFDAALRVKFTLGESDSLDLEIFNDGHSTDFRSLSGGERCMLKLCFTLSLMTAAQDKAGVEFGMILLDEPFNGLSESLKIKSFSLLQKLAEKYPSVLVIDHSEELKSQFSKVFMVTKSGGESTIG